MTGRTSAAVFLDRDGTLIEDQHYAADPAAVRLLDGVPEALAALRAAGFRLVVITNQSGIGRGTITHVQYAAVRERLDALLRAAGAPIDATYMCPHHPDATGACECRKPAPGMYVTAAGELGLDLARSYLIGNRWNDIAAAAELGARGILVPASGTPPEEIARAEAEMAVAGTLGEAAGRIVGLTARAAER